MGSACTHRRCCTTSKPAFVRAGAGRSNRFAADRVPSRAVSSLSPKGMVKAGPKGAPWDRPRKSVNACPMRLPMGSVFSSLKRGLCRTVMPGQMGRAEGGPIRTAMGTAKGESEARLMGSPIHPPNGSGDNPGVTPPLTDFMAFGVQRM